MIGYDFKVACLVLIYWSRYDMNVGATVDLQGKLQFAVANHA